MSSLLAILAHISVFAWLEGLTDIPLIVCHGGVIETSFVYCLGLNMLKTWPIHVRGTSITHWYRGTVPFERGEPLWHLYRHADQAHVLKL
jgi:broad specificity phosphatase PhoE